MLLISSLKKIHFPFSIFIRVRVRLFVIANSFFFFSRTCLTGSLQRCSFLSFDFYFWIVFVLYSHVNVSLPLNRCFIRSTFYCWGIAMRFLSYDYYDYSVFFLFMYRNFSIFFDSSISLKGIRVSFFDLFICLLLLLLLFDRLVV